MVFPKKIICLTEESVETLHLLGKEDLILGVSQYVERPEKAKNHPKVSQFIRSDIEKIVEMRPDLVLGFSDLQKDIAQELIGRGLNVFITNQRSLNEILDYILLLGRIVKEENQAMDLVQGLREKVQRIQHEAATFSRKPRVYFEEWDHPRLSCIKWVSELIEVCGGENVFAHKVGSLAIERSVTDEEVVLANPDIIFGCWCGKAVKCDSFGKRPGYQSIKAIENSQVWELPPAIFLQPGPALFVDGLDQMLDYFKRSF